MAKKWTIVIVLAALFFVGIALLAHRPRQPQKSLAQGKKEFMIKSREASQELVRRAVEALKQKQLDDAVRLLIEAVTVFPPNSEAYGMLAKVFLMTRQEMMLYETLEKAGRSYPSFDDILSVVDDENLRRAPLPVQTEAVYLAPFRDNKKMAMSFMFDDGEASVYTGVLPIFEKYGYRASISVVAGQVAPMPGNALRGSWSEWKDAADRGFEIANHSMNHRDAKTLKPSDLKLEIDDASALIEKHVGKKPVSYVFPLDVYADQVLEHVLRAGLAPRKPEFLRSVYSRTVDIMYGGLHFSVASAKRLVDVGIDRRLWLIAECHGLDVHNPDSYKPLSADFLDKVLAYLRLRTADVWVKPFGEVFEYMSLRKGTKVERKDISAVEAQVLIDNPGFVKELPVVLTVVLRVPEADIGVVTAQMPDGKSLKAWHCDVDSVCVNVSTCDDPVRVTWGRVER